MSTNTSIISTCVSVGGAFLTTLFFTKYGPSLSKKSPKKDTTSDAQTLLNLQRSVLKRDKTIKYLEHRIKKDNDRIKKDDEKAAELMALNEKLRIANEQEVLYIEELQRRLTPGQEPLNKAGEDTVRKVN